MEFISLMELIGTVAFAAAGALVAIDKELDYYGISIFAIITAVGGGIVRDIIINIPVPVSLANPLYIIISLVTTAIVIAFYKKIVKYHNVVMFCDAIGLAAFTAIGAEVALVNDVYMPFVVITLAVLTGTGGGVIRDAMCGDIPYVFREEVYAVASVLGAIAFMTIYPYFGKHAAVYTSFGVTLAARLVSMKFNLHLKKVAKQG
ncbi:MAG: trimeric intracellular cation channel family protein [Clostridiales bacterium]|uniref:trimeric intracellular cation channel family protein n=1 Tax=Aminipila sp. TaxID=2060095 RepID=UPI001D6EC551|nr:trimeric intracellular cation channel family protein [Aminipila sp.]MBE6035050.1 trimeric intracellular cation channel family protein [Clostridiales bacterium]